MYGWTHLGRECPEVDRGPDLVRIHEVVVHQRLHHVLHGLGDDA